MNIQINNNGIVSGIGAVCKNVKNAVVWSGHKVQVGFTNHLVPAVTSLWKCIIHLLKEIIKYLRTGPGLAIAASGALLAFGLTALKIATQKDFDEQDHKISQAAWKVLGTTSIAAAIISLSLGTAFLAL